MLMKFEKGNISGVEALKSKFHREGKGEGPSGQRPLCSSDRKWKKRLCATPRTSRFNMALLCAQFSARLWEVHKIRGMIPKSSESSWEGRKEGACATLAVWRCEHVVREGPGAQHQGSCCSRAPSPMSSAPMKEV